MSILNTKVLAIGAVMVLAIGCDLDGDGGQAVDAEVVDEAVEQEAEGVDLSTDAEPSDAEQAADQRKRSAESSEAAE